MPDTATPHEDAAIALRRIIADTYSRATDTEVHEHEGRFLGLTFRSGNWFFWVDAAGKLATDPRYKREEAAAVLTGRAERAAAVITPGTLFTREGEELVKVVRPDAGDCSVCGKQLADAMFRWVNRQPDPEDAFPPFDDDGRFPALRHADGSENHDGHFGPDTKARCRDCLRSGVEFKDTGYGWTSICSACGGRNYTDSGD